MHVVKILILRALSFMVGALDFLAFTLMLTLVGLPALTRFFPPRPGETYAVTAVAERYLFPALSPISRVLYAFLPHVYQGIDLTPYMLAAVLLLFCCVCTAVLRQIRVDILTLEENEKLVEAEEAAKQADVAGRLAALSADGSKRDKVLELYAQTKKILEEQRRELSFLAVDVVNSTGMKHGEDPALAERDFRHYRKLAEGVIARRQALKAAWTPDGVMICFPSLETAVLAAQDLIRGLADFNRSVKSIKADFRVRCGVNSGSVLFDESLGMEEMSDGSIDLAGHMQKYAEPDTIYAAKSVIHGQAAQLGFRPTEKKVDGCDVYEWRERGAS